MRAAITTQGGGFETTDLRDPTPVADELVIRVFGCGVCGSDLKAHRVMPPGTIMGHEICGEVVAVGGEVSGWQQDAQVAVLPLASCGHCAFCADGEVAHCASVRFIGMGGAPGGFAEFVAVPAKHAFRLPQGLSAMHGALVEPFAVGLHGVRAAGVARGDKVLVVGAGGVGLTTISWARALGAERVTAAEPLPARRDHALNSGATDAIASAAEAASGSYDAVIECVGEPTLLQHLIAAARPRGQIVLAGATGLPMQFMPREAMLKELSIRFTMAYRPSEFREVVDAFATGLINPSHAVGRTLELGRLAEAFELVRAGGTQGRVLVTPRRT